MQDSIFTKIINGDIPSHKIYEDDHTYAFLDIHPAVPGYTLVVPKRQVDHLWDLADDEYQAVMAAAKRIALHMRDIFPQARVGMKVEGLEVPHAHVKLFPFDTSAEFNQLADASVEPDHEALTAIAEKLRLDD